jgi:hypothetical protein
MAQLLLVGHDLERQLPHLRNGSARCPFRSDRYQIAQLQQACRRYCCPAYFVIFFCKTTLVTSLSNYEPPTAVIRCSFSVVRKARAPSDGALYADAHIGEHQAQSGGGHRAGHGYFNCGDVGGVPASERINAILGPVCLLLHTACAESDSLCVRSHAHRLRPHRVIVALPIAVASKSKLLRRIGSWSPVPR